MRTPILIAPLALIGALAFATSGAVGGPPKKMLPPPADKVLRRPWDSDRDYAVRVRLAKRVPKIEFDLELLDAALDEIGKLAGVIVHVNWTALEAAAVEKDVEVSFSGRDVRVDDLLQVVLDEVGAGLVDLRYLIENGMVLVTTREDMARKAQTVVYDCADLLRVEEEKLGKYVARVMKEADKYGLRGSSRDLEAVEKLVRGVIKDSRNELRDELVAAITASVNPASWEASGGPVGTIKCVGTDLVIRQTHCCHEDVFALLTSLRQKRGESSPAALWP